MDFAIQKGIGVGVDRKQMERYMLWEPRQVRKEVNHACSNLSVSWILLSLYHNLLMTTLRNHNWPPTHSPHILTQRRPLQPPMSHDDSLVCFSSFYIDDDGLCTQAGNHQRVTSYNDTLVCFFSYTITKMMASTTTNESQWRVGVFILILHQQRQLLLPPTSRDSRQLVGTFLFFLQWERWLLQPPWVTMTRWCVSFHFTTTTMMVSTTMNESQWRLLWILYLCSSKCVI